MENIHKEQVEILLEIKHKMHHLKLSDTLPSSLFKLLKMIEKHSSVIKKTNEELVAMKVNDLYDMIHISRPALSKALKECEARGYLMRFVSEKDKRYSYVGLTEKGRFAIECAQNEVVESVNWIMDQFNDVEKEQFKYLSRRLFQILCNFEKKGK